LTNEPEYRDVNPSTEGLSDKGKIIIQCFAGGIALGVLTFLAIAVKPMGLAIGGTVFFYGIMMLARRQKFNFATSLIVTASGFLMLLTVPRVGIMTGIAGTLLIIGAVALIALGLTKAIKLAWDLGKW